MRTHLRIGAFVHARVCETVHVCVGRCDCALYSFYSCTNWPKASVVIRRRMHLNSVSLFKI